MTLRELLSHRNTTQQELADLLGVTQQTVNQWVTGRRKAKLDTALRIGQKLNAAVVVSPDTAEWQYRLEREPMTDKDYEKYSEEL